MSNQCSSQASVLRLAEAGCSLNQPPPQLQLENPSLKRTFPLQTRPRCTKDSCRTNKALLNGVLDALQEENPPCSSVSASRRRRLLPSLVSASARLLLLLPSSQLQSFGQTSESTTNTPYAGAADRGVAPTTSLLVPVCLFVKSF